MISLRQGFGRRALRMGCQRALLAAADALVDAARVVGGGAPAARAMARTATPGDRYRETVRAIVLRMLVEACLGRKLAAGESSVRMALDLIDRRRAPQHRAEPHRAGPAHALERRVAAVRAGAEVAVDAAGDLPAEDAAPVRHAGGGLPDMLVGLLGLLAAIGALIVGACLMPALGLAAILIVEWLA